MADFEHSLSGLHDGPARFAPMTLADMTEAQRKVALEIMAGRKSLAARRCRLRAKRSTA